MYIKFDSYGIFKIICTAIFTLFLLSFILIFNKYGNFVGEKYNIFYISLLMLGPLSTSALNIIKKNPFLDFSNIFFLTTFIVPAVFSHLDFSYPYPRIADFTIANAVPIIVYQYFIMSFALLIVNPAGNTYFSNLSIDVNLCKALIWVAFFILLISLYERLFDFGYFDTFPAYIQILKSVFNTYISIFILFFVSFFKTNKLPRMYFIFLFGLIFLYIITSLLSGSRAISFSLFLFFIFFLRAKEYSLRISIKRIVIFSLLTPLIPFSFLVGSAIRRIIYDLEHWGSITFFPIMNQLFFQYNDFIARVIASIVSRLSYLDFSVSKISASIIYVGYVDLSYYFKSIVDKLSPGFEIFNQPFVTRQLYWVTHTVNSEDIMNSELLPVYAEMHMLFGYYSFVFALLFCIFFRYLLMYSLRISNSQISALFFLLLSYYFNTYNLGMALDFFTVFLCYLILALVIIKIISKRFIDD